MSSSVTGLTGPGLLEAGCCGGTFKMAGLTGWRTSCSILRISVSIVCKSADLFINLSIDADAEVSLN